MTEVDEAIAGELRLLDPRVRASRALIEPLLDPDFVEIGASGRRWTEEILAELPNLPSAAGRTGTRWQVLHHQGTPVPPDVA